MVNVRKGNFSKARELKVPGAVKVLDFSRIEKKWQREWERKRAFRVSETSRKKKYYVLEQYPYPSGSGLHMGHAFIYTIGDIYARLKRMQGFNVLYPIGFDSFGLPAENAAIKAKSHPKKFTDAAIENFVKHFKSFGNSYDWSRMIKSHDPEYYKWDQWIFLKMLEKGLAYRKKSKVNFCKKCKTVLANEQVVNGCCWRHEDTNVQIKELEQWFFKTTEYADELYEDIDKKLKGWPEVIKKLQKNWIGKSKGIDIDFKINDLNWKIFTTRPDTLFGVTFLVVSAQHPKVMDFVIDKERSKVDKFLMNLTMSSVSEEDLSKMEKKGVFTGSYAINPINGDKIPVFIGNFVVADYGGGIVMGVPAHDQRDFDFAQKHKLPMKLVVKPEKKALDVKKMNSAYTKPGVLINSGKFNGLRSKEAIDKITKELVSKKYGKKVIKFRLKDWLISRQRFWGTPIPVVYCDECGIVPVDEKDLPVKLPENVKFSGVKNPLVGNDKFVNVTCPKCGHRKARRETDTMDTFVNSSWYFFRYCDPKNKKKIFDRKKVNYWMPIDVYIGGKEHAVLHDIYFRFYTKFLRDLGLVNVDEPALSLFNQGFIYGENGKKMSKSLGNVVVPREVAKKYGVDSVRLFLVSVASPDKDFSWSDKGVEGSWKFILRIMKFVKNFNESKMSKLQESKLNRTIKDYTEDIVNFRYNLAVIKLRELFSVFEAEGCDKKSLQIFLKLLSPICPHVAEELWSKLKGRGFISLADWPKEDKKKINDKLEEEEKQRGKVVEDVKNILKILGKKKSNRVYLYVLPKELESYDADKLVSKIGLPVAVFAVNDSEKYDPEGKSKKVKPGRPGIYVE